VFRKDAYPGPGWFSRYPTATRGCTLPAAILHGALTPERLAVVGPGLIIGTGQAGEGMHAAPSG
jgi:hypothetical protein